MKKDDGFTLMETLLVLSILSLLISFPIVQFSSMREESEHQLFFDSLRSSITLIQTHAVINNEWTVMEVRPVNNKIYFRVPAHINHPASHTLSLPDGITIQGTSRDYDFKSGTGNQGNLHPVIFQTRKGKVELKFQMGSGRFVID